MKTNKKPATNITVDPAPFATKERRRKKPKLRPKDERAIIRLQKNVERVKSLLSEAIIITMNFDSVVRELKESLKESREDADR